MNPVRQAAAWVYRILITAFAAAVVAEFFLAGLGIFRSMPDEDKSVSHDTFSDKFDAHAGLGFFLFLGSLLLLIAILVAWTGPRAIGETFGLAVLTFVQMILGGAGEDAPVAGAFHVINALLILGLSWLLTFQAWRWNLLIPPSQRRGTAPSPPPAS
jgi:sterol desaturase/sphingolipid hydroxylase (fatty acid hydroxylase superfamily)